ncbi:MAG TPA: MoxR family ATPase [Bacteroidales bacterium]|jgi:MoxR-like ATPase|nr:MoxR family ATPase [Bacteroidales bacterium]
MNFTDDVAAVNSLQIAYDALKKEIHKKIVGQDAIIDDVLLSIFSKGHCLLVGVPGLAKTLLVTTIAQTLGLQNNRIQFTPDLMPSDIIGTEILDSQREFKFIKGPIFTNFLLADEINRTPPKTQAALLEAMQERAVTAAGIRHLLPEPFFVLATQNPIEQEGTYPLPEAQLDRFMFNVWLDYPSVDEEIEIVKTTTGTINNDIQTILTSDDILQYQQIIRKIPVNDSVVRYAVELVAKTRKNTACTSPVAQEYISWGAGPRASQYLIIGAKAHAAIHGKYSPDIDDVKAIALPILRHRIVKNYKAEADGLRVDDIITRLMS